MVASLLELRLLGLTNRVVRPRSRAERITAVLALLAGVGALAAIGALGDLGSTTTPELRHAVFVTAGSIVVAGFWLAPFVMRTSGGLEPRAFAAFPVTPTRLAVGLATAALLSIPVLLLVLLVVVDVISWSASGPEAALAAAGAGLLAIVIAVLGSLVASVIASDGIVMRNTAGVIVVAIVAALAPLLGLVDWAALGFTYLRRAAAALAWTPFGVAWAAPGEAVLGREVEAWLHVVAACAIIVVLWLAWAALVRRGVRRRPHIAGGRAAVRLGAFDALPDTQTGVVAARSVTYWLRDARYIVPLLILPLVPAGLVLAFWLAGVPWSVIIWLPVPLVGLLIGWSVHNDVAADGTAFWLHVVTSVRGRADRWGRVLVPLLIGLPVVIVGGIVTAWLHGEPGVGAPLVSLGVCALLAGLGVSSVASALTPYPTVHPGDSPFQQPQGATAGAGLQQVLSLAIAVIACLPVVGAILAAGLAASPDYTAATALGFVIGPVLLVLGVEVGAVVMRRRSPELLAFTQQN